MWGFEMVVRPRPTRPKPAARRTLIGVLSALTLGACSGDAELREFPERSVSMAPTVVRPFEPVDLALQCIRETGALRGVTFVVGPFADRTGKINASSPGATGNFVPPGGSAAYVTDALARAGARVVSTYFGPPAESVPAQYAINGIFNSLDFATPYTADIRVMGSGPMAVEGWAQLSLTIQLDEILTRLNRQMSMIQRPVRFSSLGGAIGRELGGRLVTGSVAYQDQERLQFEAINGPIALGVVDVILNEFPETASTCAPALAPLLLRGYAEMEASHADVVSQDASLRPVIRPDPGQDSGT